MPASESNTPLLRADYKAPGASKKFSYAQQALDQNPTPKQTTAYIASLRTSTLQLQGEINTFLTQKMEDDKAAASLNGNGAQVKVDEQKEEENYGEEVEED